VTDRPYENLDIDWTPLKSGGTNFSTHRLVNVDSDTLSFEPTKGALFFYWVFIVFGLIPFGISIWQIMERGFQLTPEILVPLGFGLIFGSVGLTLYRFGTRPIVFDLKREYFWKGRKDPDSVWDRRELKHFAQLDDVVGLQVLTEVVSSDKGSFRSYELNLVLRDGSRLNVVDHGNEGRLEQDARSLADFLGVEILER
jgi:hypothetical protein